MSAHDVSPDYFRVLEPPANGLERLRVRIAKQRSRPVLRPIIAFASFALIAMLAGNLWNTFDTARQERLAIAELESIFTSARLPPLSIDGVEATALELGRDDVLVFWVTEQH